MRRDDAARADRQLAPILRKCPARPSPELDESALTDEQRSNLRSKRRFEQRCLDILGPNETIRTLAKFFGVPRSTLFERMRDARTDIAPIPAWFEKLDRYEEFERLTAEFARRIA